MAGQEGAGGGFDGMLVGAVSGWHRAFLFFFALYFVFSRVFCVAPKNCLAGGGARVHRGALRGAAAAQPGGQEECPQGSNSAPR